MLSSKVVATSNAMATPIYGARSVLRSAARAHRSPRPSQQTRSFRLNMWSSYLDPVFKKEVQRHSRGSRRKYIETLNQKLLWDGQIPDYARRQLKGLMCTALHRRDQAAHGGRWSDFDIFSTNGKEPKANEDGIEDVEKDAVETLLHRNFSTEKDYEIDPITNRKVFKKPSNKPQPTHNRVDNIRERPSENENDVYTGRRAHFSFRRQTNKPSNETTEPPLSSGGGIHYRSIIFPGPIFPMETDSPPKPQESSPKPSSSQEGRSQNTVKHTPKKNSDLGPAESGLKSYDSKAAYDQPFMAYEPDGQPPSQDLPNPVEDGFDIYDAKLAEGRRAHKGKSTDTERPWQRKTRVEKSRDPEAGLEEYDSKASYDKPFMAYEPDGQKPIKEPEDLEQKGWEAYDKKHPYGPVYHNEPDGKPDEQTCTPDQDGWEAYDKKHPYGPVYHNEPDGNPPGESAQPVDPVQEGLRDYDNRISYSPKPPLAAKSKYAKLFSNFDLETPAFSTYSFRSQEHPEGLKRRQLAEEFDKAQDSWMATLKEGSSATKNLGKQKAVRDVATQEGSVPSQSPKITGNFVRDFPEEFQMTWSAGKSNSESLIPLEGTSGANSMEINQSTLENKMHTAEKAYIEGLAPAESFSRKPDTPRLQPSLDRSACSLPKSTGTGSEVASATMMQGEGDLSESVSSYGRTSPAALPEAEIELEKLRHEIQNIYEDSMTPAGSVSAEKPIPKVTLQQPTLYKILVYDPTMQNIDIAETTSVVTDSSSALTPAEVLLRLSNPAKFFPHFEPLQSQGYEIVSGSGDVLVFRKVQDGPPSGVTAESSANTQDRQRLSTNPIDGMQSSPIVTGNFASPTGFVNHDLPTTEPSTKPESTTTRDTEQDFESRGFSEQDFEDLRQYGRFYARNERDYERAERKRQARKRKVKRVLVISSGMAGVAYVVGVVGEYFKTGGIDGSGPTGF